ncbi:MAG: histidine kinase [Brooklawnia sp.]|jgi:signal transduction histidine kinase
MTSPASEHRRRLLYERRSLHTLLGIMQRGDDERLTPTLVCERAVAAALDLTNFDCAVVRSYHQESDAYVIRAQQGLSPRLQGMMSSAPASTSINGVAARRRWPVMIEHLDQAEYQWDRGIDWGPERFTSVISVPLLRGERVMGTMELANFEPYVWDEDEVGWLALVGHVVGVLLSESELRERAAESARMRERVQLSREIHDGVVQTLGVIRLLSEGALEACDGGDPEAARQLIARINSTSGGAYAELRAAMTQLRPGREPSAPGVEALRTVAEDFSTRWAMPVEFVLRPPLLADHPALTPEATLQLSRLVQEALTNVRQHAAVQGATVSVTSDPDWFTCEVRDQGRGFDPALVGEDHVGLEIMSERVSDLGGTLSVVSAVGEGTQVVARVPRASIDRQAAHD